MEFGWILLGLACWVFVILLAVALMRVADDQDRAALRAERRLPPKPEAPGAEPWSRTETGERQ